MLQPLGGAPFPPWLYNLRRCWFSKKSHFVNHENGVTEWLAFHQRLHFLGDLSGPISASAQPSLLQPLGRSSWPPWSLRFEILLVFKSFFVFCHETGVMEDWPALHQFLHFRARKSAPTLVLAQPSLLQPLRGASFPPWLSNLRCCWFQRKIILQGRVAGTLHQRSHLLGDLSGPISALAQPSLPELLSRGSSWPPWSLRFETLLVFKSFVVFCHEAGTWKNVMVGTQHQPLPVVEIGVLTVMRHGLSN